MSDTTKTPVPELTECTQANVLAEAAAALAAQAAAKAAAAKAKAAEAAARAASIRNGVAAEAAKPAEAVAPAVKVEAAVVPVAAPVVKVEPPTPKVEAVPVAAPAAPVPATATEPKVAEKPAVTLPAEAARAKPEPVAATPATVRVPTVVPAVAAAVEAPAVPVPATGIVPPALIPEGASVRKIQQAKSAEKIARMQRRAGPAAAPGMPMEPVAHSAGLHVHGRGRRKIISPGLVFLFALMAFFGLYATGNLPQFDRWTDRAIQTTQGENAQVVGTLVGGWRMIAWGAAGVCVLLIAFFVINAMRARSSDGE